MGLTVSRYAVDPAHIAENRTLVRQVFDVLGDAAPTSVRYLVLELGTGEFIHLVDDDGGTRTLTESPAFKALSRHQASRRQGPISRSTATIVGDYRMPRSDA